MPMQREEEKRNMTSIPSEASSESDWMVATEYWQAWILFGGTGTQFLEQKWQNCGKKGQNLQKEMKRYNASEDSFGDVKF